MTCVAWLAAFALAQAGPVGYWKGDDGAAPTVATDSSGNGHHGTYVNGATTSPLVPGTQFTDSRSMIFDGVNDYVDVPTFSWPAGGPVTVAFWNFVATADIQQANAFSVGNQDNPSRFQAHVPWENHNMYWDYGDWTGNGRVSINYDPYLDKWTHVALVSEGNGGAFMGIYLDGALVASSNVSDGPDVPLSGLTIGYWAMFNNRHKGKIDDFRIYNRVLTSAQVLYLAVGFTEPSAPTLTAAAATGGIQLNWTSVSGAGFYDVKRSQTSGGPYLTLATLAGGNAYFDSTPTPTQTYYYVVAAIGVSQGPNSNEQAAAAPGQASPVDIVVSGCGALGIEGFLLLAGLGLVGRRSRRPSPDSLAPGP
jgi:hypothetical protein